MNEIEIIDVDSDEWDKNIGTLSQEEKEQMKIMDKHLTGI